MSNQSLAEGRGIDGGDRSPISVRSVWSDLENIWIFQDSRLYNNSYKKCMAEPTAAGIFTTDKAIILIFWVSEILSMVQINQKIFKTPNF